GDPEQAVGGPEPQQALAVLEQRAGGIADHALAAAQLVPAALPVAQHHTVGGRHPDRAAAVHQQPLGALAAHAVQAAVAVPPHALLAGDPGRAPGIAGQCADLARRQPQAPAPRLERPPVPAVDTPPPAPPPADYVLG